ncbi:hypothetical protein NCTGTJJY_CDS0082 [Serratia phage 92A1]|nr:hypothetical protein NCTGTJJY_CDS0082 [Serratia phage 92A1]
MTYILGQDIIYAMLKNIQAVIRLMSKSLNFLVHTRLLLMQNHCI